MRSKNSGNAYKKDIIETFKGKLYRFRIQWKLENFFEFRIFVTFLKALRYYYNTLFIIEETEVLYIFLIYF